MKQQRLILLLIALVLTAVVHCQAIKDSNSFFSGALFRRYQRQQKREDQQHPAVSNNGDTFKCCLPTTFTIQEDESHYGLRYYTDGRFDFINSTISGVSYFDIPNKLFRQDFGGGRLSAIMRVPDGFTAYTYYFNSTYCECTHFMYKQPDLLCSEGTVITKQTIGGSLDTLVMGVESYINDPSVGFQLYVKNHYSVAGVSGNECILVEDVQHAAQITQVFKSTGTTVTNYSGYKPSVDARVFEIPEVCTKQCKQ